MLTSMLVAEHYQIHESSTDSSSEEYLKNCFNVFFIRQNSDFVKIKTPSSYSTFQSLASIKFAAHNNFILVFEVKSSYGAKNMTQF